MKIINRFQIIWLGLMIWIVPFVAGFLFYNSEGELTGDIYFFKSIMILTLSFVTGVAIFLYSRSKKIQTVQHCMVIALVWMMIPVILDRFLLIPLSGTNIPDYINQIGLRYLIIPIMISTVALSNVGKTKKIANVN